MTLLTYLDRAKSYLGAGIGGLAGGFKAAEAFKGLKSHVEQTVIADPRKKQSILNDLEDVYKQALDGHLIQSFRSAKYLISDLYGEIFLYPDYVKGRIRDYIKRDEILTDAAFAVDLAEFLPPYKRLVERLLKLRPVKWLNGLVGTDLDPIDLGMITYIGIKTGYFKHYWHDVFAEHGYTWRALNEAFRGTFKVIIHVGIEKALPGETAAFYPDDLGFALDAYRSQIERAIPQQVHMTREERARARHSSSWHPSIEEDIRWMRERINSFAYGPQPA
ncbi:MAG: hypothetical protein HYW26_02825 [Candidatus Aenigmarchaeota archaeon]|nr:hypothetical protein [Candidatus Aenigmarchaeota archaeon]